VTIVRVINLASSRPSGVPTKQRSPNAVATSRAQARPVPSQSFGQPSAYPNSVAIRAGAKHLNRDRTCAFANLGRYPHDQQGVPPVALEDRARLSWDYPDWGKLDV
jgi:hypothetical protein